MFKKEIISLIQRNTLLSEEQILKLIEIPPNEDFGDYSFPCFILSKEFRKSPNEISLELSKKIKPTKLIRKIDSKGPYLNFFINKTKLTSMIIKKILKEKDKYGFFKGKRQKIMIEFSQPNTNKPMHLGHVRNNTLGSSLANILEFTNNEVIRVNLINDRGIHICKSMLAYQKWGKNTHPSKEIKGDHFVGNYYVLFSKNENQELLNEAQEMLRQWENDDKKIIALWRKMNSWVLKGFNETYKNFGIKFDRVYYESQLYKKGKKVILDALKKGLVQKGEGNEIFIDLSEYGLGKKVLIRFDGTSIYITQDIYLSILRHKENKLSKLIYVVASEQDYHFKALFKILEILGYSWAKNCYHLSYGLVHLPEGRMKSREGKVVDADNLFEEIINLSKKEILKRNKKINRKELERRAKQISLGALNFYMLKIDPAKDMIYYPEESISFEGETGPYIQYVHARINSILKKTKFPQKVNYSLLKQKQENDLIDAISKFQEKVQSAAKSYKPSIIANYLIDISQKFNTFYDSLSVLKAEPELKNARLHLIAAVKQVLKNGLTLLNIEAPVAM